MENNRRDSKFIRFTLDLFVSFKLFSSECIIQTEIKIWWNKKLIQLYIVTLDIGVHTIWIIEDAFYIQLYPIT